MKIKVKVTTPSNMKHFGCASGSIVEVEFEDYVRCVVASEIGKANLEACKAQAVASRTFAASRGVLEGKAISDDASKAQAYIAARDYYDVCNQAAAETAGEVLTYNGQYCTTYFSHSNGGTVYACEEVWSQKKPYLVHKTDEWTKKSGVKRNGHGIGMSQAGAKYAGANGVGYREILNFYYPNTTLTKIKTKEEPQQDIEDDYVERVLADIKVRVQLALKEIEGMQ